MIAPSLSMVAKALPAASEILSGSAATGPPWLWVPGRGDHEWWQKNGDAADNSGSGAGATYVFER